MIGAAILAALIIAIIAILIGAVGATQNIISAIKQPSVITSPPTKGSCYYGVNIYGGVLTPYNSGTSLGSNNYGSIVFTPGLWRVSIYSYIFTEGISTPSYLTVYQLGLSTGDGVTDPIDYINNSGTDPANDLTTGTGAYVDDASGPTATNLTSLSLPYGSGPLYMPTLTIYVNVPQSVTYYLMGSAFFTANSASVTSATSPFVNYVQATAVKLGRCNTNMPYSSTFSTKTGTSGASGASGASGSSKSNSFKNFMAMHT